MALVLHTSSGNKNAFEGLIAAEYSGIKVELVKDFQMGVSNKTPEFLKMNPIGKKLDTLVKNVSQALLCRFLSWRLLMVLFLKAMRLHDMAHIEQWMDFAATEVDANIGRWLYPRMGFYPYAAVSEEVAFAALKRALGSLNTHLASNTFLVGHSVTLADIVLTCNLYIGFLRILTKSFTSEVPHVKRYFWTMVNQPNFKKVIGDVKQAEAVPPVQKKAAPAKEQKPKESKKEAPKPKVAEKPAEEEEAPKPKPKNPLDLLPPRKMILDDWKRLYSNTKTNFREVAIKGFWDMYDPEGYSLWFCDYTSTMMRTQCPL
ncbi:hypothetical protein U9M48_025177 [Paspalum notatum var. saurae]|uniref:Uncharacterized protein n=1 Tax=Paspalum notatum var. saurae TaxID=547442 RepID=A0AAQ3TNA0_PASNO